jgi:N utilization substance protein A
MEGEIGQVQLSIAKRTWRDAEIGKVYEEDLPPFEIGRVQTQMARQVVMHKVREAERERQYDEYKDRVGEIVNGSVKRVEYGNVIVDLGRGEGIMRRDQSIPRENFNVGDRIRAYIYDVRRETKGPQIMLSRAHGGFMAKLFAQEVPEVYDGVIEIRAVARDPGSRAKMAVISNDSSIDPVGACVGMRGSRVQAVVAELQGEKIDIIQWSEDEATFIVNALAPAEVSKVVMDEEDERVEVVVPDEQLSLAIGRRGQNVRLASQLTGWQIDIMTESQESERRQKQFTETTALFQEALDVDEVIAQLLVTEGFAAVEDVAYVEPHEIAAIEGFDDETAEELQARAREFLDKEAAALDAKRVELGVEDGRARDRRRHPAHGRRPGRRRREDRRGPGRPGPGRHARLVRDQERRARARAGHPGKLQPVAGRRRSADHARPDRHGLGRGPAGAGIRRDRVRGRIRRAKPRRKSMSRGPKRKVVSAETAEETKD